MRVDVARCASCNTIVPAPLTRTRRTCAACVDKQRKAAIAGMPRCHHIYFHLTSKKGSEEDDDDAEDDDDGHWPY